MLQVEISNLKGVIPTWKVTDVQRKLKDYYFPYIQVQTHNLTDYGSLI